MLLEFVCFDTTAFACPIARNYSICSHDVFDEYSDRDTPAKAAGKLHSDPSAVAKTFTAIHLPFELLVSTSARSSAFLRRAVAAAFITDDVTAGE